MCIQCVSEVVNHARFRWFRNRECARGRLCVFLQMNSSVKLKRQRDLKEVCEG